MSVLVTRRTALCGLMLAPWSFARVADPADMDAAFRALEQTSGGRLGVAILNTATGARANHRGAERFPMCSTFKLLAAAAVLARVDRGAERLDRRVPYTEADLLEYAPVTKARVKEGSMPLADLCDAAITVSDNTAGNLLLTTIGGPAGFTKYVRSLGDRFTRLDRIEPFLNEATPGDVRDTTTPSAMLGNLRSLLVGDALSKASRETLAGWLVGSKVGAARLRAGVPAGWRVGDKTGSGDRGTTNDVAIVWPPDGRPILINAFLTKSTAASEVRERTLADVARAVTR